ncbi:fimbrial protein [Rahnella laticis]|uniref:fimbrial protein n=1 Tax=Rahnella laticis TaxID=2787622 RepID=UPI0018A28C84|nr:fimbrial protein [Rahnella laticis]MBF7997761.1 type 1 fimbrial protein [Rahnella laticis]
MNRQLLVVAALFCLSPPAFSASHGHGLVEVHGSIIDTACAITTGDVDQGIDLGTLSASDLVGSGHGPQVPFTVHLINCSLEGATGLNTHHWKDVHITFDGVSDGERLFALQGTAQGEGVMILDSSGVSAEPGEPMPDTAIEPGSMALHYRLQIMSDHSPLRPGSFATTLRYFMEYE